MTALSDQLDKLLCPECGGGFSFSECATSSPGSGEFGILQCGCFAYPVLDSVPILLQDTVAQFSFGSGAVESQGPAVAQVSEWVREGRGVEALIECLTFTPTIDVLDRLPIWRIWHGKTATKLTREWMRKQVRRLVLLDEAATAEDWLELYFRHHEGGNRVLLDYYRNRFVLPRTLATYALVELLPTETTVLDVACGLGPFPHFLARRAPSSKVIGFDFNFYLVWWQRRFMAPDQLFLCADGGKRLPFKDDVFGAIYCSDSFVYLPNREQLVSEYERCAPGRPVATTRVANGEVFPKGWGEELSPEAYMNLLGERTQAYREFDLVRYYLDRVNPLQRDATAVSEMRHDKWLYFMTNAGDEMQGKVLDGVKPHIVGSPTLNPLFARQSLGNGRTRLLFNFPSIWFAYQNADMYGYHGDRTECSDAVLSQLGSDAALAGLADGGELSELSENFVVIGLPPRYLRA